MLGSLVKTFTMLSFYVGFQNIINFNLYVGDMHDSCKNSMKGIVLILDKYYIFRLRKLAVNLWFCEKLTLVYIHVPKFSKELFNQESLEYESPTRGMCMWILFLVFYALWCDEWWCVNISLGILCTMMRWRIKHWLLIYILGGPSYDKCD